MKFIHTSDWHLGKTLNGYSRLKEQRKFCEELVEIVEDNEVDMVIITGEVYDTSSPTYDLEELFYKTVLKLANNGQRCVLIIPGNNENLKKLLVASTLMYERGVIIQGKNDEIKSIAYEEFEILERTNRCIKLNIKNEKVTVIILDSLEEESQNTDKGILDLENKFEQNSINIAVGNLIIDGCEKSESDELINDLCTINRKNLPRKAQYIALGYLHKMQQVSKYLNAYYSGAPITYSKEERTQQKGVYLVHATPNRALEIQEIYFRNYKPIKVFNCNGIKEALDICKKNKENDIWSYFEIKTEKAISHQYICKMRDILNDIVEISIDENVSNNQQDKLIREKTIEEKFKNFYYHKNKIEPKGELMSLFLDIINEEGESINETN